MYPFNYISNQQNQICFPDYGASSGKWCGNRAGLISNEGYFDSGVLFKSGNGLSKSFNSTNLNEFTVEYWSKLQGTGVIFKSSNFEFGLQQNGTGLNNYYDFGSGRVTGVDNETGEWGHYGLSVSGYKTYTGTGYIENFGRYKNNLSGSCTLLDHLSNGSLLTGYEKYMYNGFLYTDNTNIRYPELGELNSYTIQFWSKLVSTSIPSEIEFIAFYTGDIGFMSVFDNFITWRKLANPPFYIATGYSINFNFKLEDSPFSARQVMSLHRPSEFTHVTLTFDKGVASGYVDGILASTGYFTGNYLFQNSGNRVILQKGGASTESVGLDEFILLSGANSSGDIYSNYHKQIESPLSRSDLLHYYKFDGFGNQVFNKNYSFYKNGLLQITGNSIDTESSLSLSKSYVGQKLTGSFDEFRLWTGARFSGEVYQYYNQSLTNLLGFAQSGLYSYVPFGTGVSMIDFSQNDFSNIDFY